MPLHFADAVAEIVKTHLGIEKNPEAGLVQVLASVSPEDLLSKIPPNVQFVPVVDGDIIPKAMLVDSWAGAPELPGNRFIESILVGNSKLDVSHYTIVVLTY